MKKHQLLAAVSTVALAANLLLPNLAFGQQTASQPIGCPTPGAGPSIGTLPANVTFDSKTPNLTSTQDSFDAAVSNGAVLPQNHLISVSDARSQGVDECPALTPGWTLTVTSTNLVSDVNAADTIANSSLRIVTSNEADRGLLDIIAQQVGEEVMYSVGAGPGNAHDVDAPVLYDDVDRDPGVTNSQFEHQENYQNAYVIGDADYDQAVPTGPTGAAFNNTLGGAVTLLTKATGQNMSVFTGIALMVDDGIAANQPRGTYTGTLTYSVVAS